MGGTWATSFIHPPPHHHTPQNSGSKTASGTVLPECPTSDSPKDLKMQIPCSHLKHQTGCTQDSAFKQAGGQSGGMMGKGAGPAAPSPVSWLFCVSALFSQEPYRAKLMALVERGYPMGRVTRWPLLELPSSLMSPQCCMEPRLWAAVPGSIRTSRDR